MDKKKRNINDVLKTIFSSEYIGIVISIALVIGLAGGLIYGLKIEKNCMNGHSRTYHRMGYDQNGDFHTDYETKTLQAEICESKGIGEGFITKQIFKYIFISFILTLGVTICCEYFTLNIKYRTLIYFGLAILVALAAITLSSSKINREAKEKEEKQKAAELEKRKKEEIEPFCAVWFTSEFNDHYNVTLSIFNDNACYYSYYKDPDSDEIVKFKESDCTYTYKDNKVTVKADESFTCSIENKKLSCNGVIFDYKYN